MKKSFVTVLTAFITVFSLIFTVNSAAAGVENGVTSIADSGDQLTLQNERFAFEINKKNGCFTVVDKKSAGNTYYSNPISLNGDLTAEAMYSQLSLEYYSDSNVLTTMNSYEHSAKLGNLAVTKEKDTIKAVYTFGKIKIDRSMVPTCFTKEEFSKLLSKDGIDTELFKGAYILIDKKSEYYDEFKEQYPLLKKQSLYILDKYAANYKIEKIYKQFNDIGFDIDQHNEKHGIKKEEDSQVQITVTVEYRLTYDGFKVTVPCKQIKTVGNATLTTIKVLPYYESAYASEEGYMLLPDGSGAIINFDNTNTELANANVQIYGLDDVITVKQKTEYNARSVMPIYGINKGNRATLAIIEEGDALATVYSSVCGKNNLPVTSVYAGFLLCPYELITVTAAGSKTSYNVYSSKRYSQDISIRFILLDEPNASYSKMAVAYREYLIENKSIAPSKNGGYPLSVELLGAMTKNKNFLGIPYKKTYALTTYNDAAVLINKIKTGVADELVVKYSGWCNNGLIQGYAGKIKPVSALGKKKSFKEFNQSLKELGINCYFDIKLQQINEKILNTKINISKKGARCIYNDVAVVSDINLSTMLPLTKKRFDTDSGEIKSYLLSPKFLKSLAKSAVKKMSEYKIENISYADLGSMLYSDFSTKNFTNRQSSLNTIKEILDGQSGFAVNGGDFYTLKNADIIYDMPLVSSQRLIYDREIPFAQIVLHGCVQYTGEAINLSDNPEASVLKAVETGALLNYTFASKNIGELKNSSLNNYYSVSYDSSKESMENYYRKIYPIQSKLSLMFITEHEYLTDNVTKTVYDDGTEVIVNYGESVYEYGGKSIAPGDFVYIA